MEGGSSSWQCGEDPRAAAMRGSRGEGGEGGGGGGGGGGDGGQDDSGGGEAGWLVEKAIVL